MSKYANLDPFFPSILLIYAPQALLNVFTLEHG